MWAWVTGSTSAGTQEGAKPQSGAVVVPGLPAPKSDMDYVMAASELLEDVRWVHAV